MVSGGCQILRKGLQWEVGSGASISFLNGPWVAPYLLKVWPNMSFPSSIGEDVTVQEFITPERSWDTRRLLNTVGQEVTRAICWIPLPHGLLDDRLKFLGNELGEYSVKKAYSILLDNSPIVARNEWKGIWQLSCYQRIRTWFWKVLRGCVPTKAFLYTRGKTTTMRCPRFNQEAKNLYHLLLHCPLSLEI